MLTNDEYHDILDAIKAAKADFGYVNISEDGTSFEVEAYQISPRSRFQNEEWPPWFNMQRRPDDVNAVYCDASIPDSLVLAMVGGEQVLSSGDWVVRFKNGDLSVLADSDFKKFSKVVPIPADPYIPPADNPDATDPRLEKPALTVVESVPEFGQVLNVDLEDDVCKALDALVAEDLSLAQEILTKAMMKRVTWCDCAPGSCAETKSLGCRRNSPLVK